MANFIDFVTSMIYGDLGASELGAAPAGTRNHLNWTLDELPASGSTTVTGTQFLTHHLDVMLNRYEAWRSLHTLPPVRPWDGTDVFPDPTDPAPVQPAMPATLNGSPFPTGWTLNDLGTAVRGYYNALRNFSDSSRETEMTDEIRAPFSYRYWSFMKWVYDLRRRLLVQPVYPVGLVFDRYGILLSEKEFSDVFNQMHHIWHPNSGTITSWTTPTPFFETSVGQFRRKKQLSRTQVGNEFFAFHRDLLLLRDRWLARSSQDPVQSINMCGHDSSGFTFGTIPAGLEVVGNGTGIPLTNYSTRALDFTPDFNNMWDGSHASHDGRLGEFSSPGLMGQFFATDFNPFSFISVPAANAADSGYHGQGHVRNGDIVRPTTNNYCLRFYAWHGFIDDLWAKRQPQFNTFVPVSSTSSPYAGPQILTILRDFSASTDSVEPANAIPGINLSNGRGTLRVKFNVRTDPFNRPLELRILVEVLREGGTPAVPITLPVRSLVMTTGAPVAANERQQNTDFIEEFVFDGSAGTEDSDGDGPFKSNNLNFPPAGAPNTGFKNTQIRITATMHCAQQADGSTTATPGTLSSSGTALTGSGTNFTATFNQGDLLRASGQIRRIITINSATSITLDEAFSPNLAAGTAYERADGFDHKEVVRIPLLQETDAPQITPYLDHSSFSLDEVNALASGGSSVFNDAFYIVLQDRTARPEPIVWPSDPNTDQILPWFKGLIAPTLYGAGLYADTTRDMSIIVRDATTNADLSGQVDVAIISATRESAFLHPGVPQRVTYNCRVTFTGTTAFAGMVAGDLRNLKLEVTARDRSGNTVVDDSTLIRLQVNPNPYMIDGDPAWLSTDTRVFQIQQGQARFGVAAGWTNPNTFITQVIQNFRTGNGTAGGENFTSLPSSQAGSALEYSTQVNGQNIYNFALSRVRLVSQTGINNVRVFFRFFRWGTANVAFNNTLAYRTNAASAIPLLGRTSSSELASIPFFAEGRVGTAASMTTQTDPTNQFSFTATAGAEVSSYFGAYLDINQSALRFPQTFINDGPFNSLPPGSLRSIRDLVVGQHQCMVVEIFHTSDPTDNGSTPGTSDNLAQRNLLILQTANPGSPPTRMVQHSFDIDLSRAWRYPNKVRNVENETETDLTLDNVKLAPGPRTPIPARPEYLRTHPKAHILDHLRGSWISEEELQETQKIEAEELDFTNRWTIDMDEWKSNDGMDELMFLWNDLPSDSVVEIYFPNTDVTEIVNYRNLRHAPETVNIVDVHTLRLLPVGTTYLPMPPFWGENLAGLITITLPPGIEAGQVFTVDVRQVRSDEKIVLGGFQLSINVSKAERLIDEETRMLEIFHRRLELTPGNDRWRPILEHQVDFFRDRARGFVDLADDPDIQWEDPTVNAKGEKIRVILDCIQILNDQDPCLLGKGEFRFAARVQSPDNGGQDVKLAFPAEGHYSISDREGQNVVELDLPLFEGYIDDFLAIEIRGSELDLFHDDPICPYRRVFRGRPSGWLGAYGPDKDAIDQEDLGDWRLWYRIERV